ncbi:TVP38/TMEM64 family protein [Actinokineospora sp. PR83]|uniref:TVP38/TMEM64 family protein n=1 Tax=Actinokineospora sp. PR83 TaxID=2884908 RepID=UPI0027DEB53B|nr:TVP38/TMEM64 family protein [Actinokineospora sp. PR83]
MSGRRVLIALLAAVVALVVAGSLVPIPSPVEVRDWAAGFGWATPVLFLAAYSLLTVPPVPRTVFNLSVGLVLGEGWGIVIAMAATTIAAALAFWLSRGLGRRWVEPHLERAVLRAVNSRLTGSGFAGVLGLRLIPMVPFSAMNYCCGLSEIRWQPYLAGTFLGSVPGTVAAVLLGDALTGTTPPELLAVYGVLAVVGAVLMWAALRRARPEVLEPVGVSGS